LQGFVSTSITNSFLFLGFLKDFSSKNEVFSSLTSQSSPWPFASKPFIGNNYQIPTMSFQIITFIVIEYYFPCPHIFLLSIFNMQYQNSLIYTPVPLFPHKSLSLKFNPHFEPFLFFGHFRTSIFKFER
jgi:hypothetical protein